MSYIPPLPSKSTNRSKPATESEPATPLNSTTKLRVKHEIETLSAVADDQFDINRYQYTYNTPYDGKSIALLSINHCLAVQNPSSPRIARFTERYREVGTWNINTIDTHLLTDELWRFFARFNELFFFNLFRRKVSSPWGFRDLLTVQFIDSVDDDERHRIGTFIRNEWRILIWLRMRKNPNVRLPFRTILATCLHELVHAYLELADKQHVKHMIRVYDFGGHAEYFWILLHSLAGMVMKFTDSESWRREIDIIERECSSKTQGKWDGSTLLLTDTSDKS